MSTTSFDQTYTSSSSITIPNNASNVRLTIQGARGGNGFNGGVGGGGRNGRFRYTNDFVGLSLDLYPGQNGGSSGDSNGAPGGSSPLGSGGSGGSGSYSFTVSQTCEGRRGYRRNGPGDCGCNIGEFCTGTQGNGDLCCGGRLGTPGECFCCGYTFDCSYTAIAYTGGGGGGGSAVGWVDNTYGVIACIAGGGGGGGGFNGGGGGFGARSWVATSNVQGSNGTPGGNRGFNGGEGGGGGSAQYALIDPANWQEEAPSLYNSNILTLQQDLGLNTSANPQIRVQYTSNTPEITNLIFTPTLLSASGVPQYNSTVTWSVIDFQTINLSGPGVNFNTTSGSSSYTVTLPQSVAGSNSPACQSFTLTACAGSTCTSQNFTLCANNDNTPSNITVNPTAIAASPSPLSALEPLTTYYVEVTYQGTDMNTLAVSSDSGVRVANVVNSWASSRLIPPGDPLYVQFTSLPFNTSTTPGGTVNGEIVGQTNTKTITIGFGTESFSFNAVTRAPVIQETYNFEAFNPVPTVTFPDPDIDTNVIDDPTYIVTGPQTMNDIEIDVEIRTGDPDTQVQINADTVWRDMRSL